MDRRDKWKSKPRNFESEEARILRVDQHQARRQTKKEEQLNRLRQVSPAQDDEEEFEDTPEDRAIRLVKWKAERDLKKKLEAKNKRPAFVIGVPHHNFFSPVSKDPPKPHCHKKPKGSSPPKRVTAVTARRLAAKQAVKATTSGPSSASQPSTSTGATRIRPPKTPMTPRLTRSRKKALEVEKKPEKKPIKKESLAPENYEFKGPTFAEPIPLFGAVIVPGVDTNLTFTLTDNFKTIKAEKTPIDTLTENNGETPLESSQPPKEFPKKHSPEKKTAKKPSPEKRTPREISPKKKTLKKTSPEKLPPRNSESITRQESSQPCDSSIESVILRMSSQFEPLKPAEDITEEKENVNMNLDPDPSRLLDPVPAQFSPFIVTSRGKSSARKEQKQRLSLHKSSPKDDIPTKDSVMQNLSISVEEEKNTSQYYKHLVESEEARLKDLCSTWKPLQEDPSTPEDGVYMINQAIGQTNLLIRKKFERFKTLVNDCETGMGEQLVRCADLQGFWEMMQMEIINCNSRFTKLEEIRGKGWQEDDEVVVRKKAVQKKKSVVKKKVEGRSNMRAFIEAQRKKKMAPEGAVEEENPEVKEPQVDPKPSTTPRKSLPMPVSPHSRAKVTPRGERLSLLKLVQLTESAKRMTQNSFAMVKVSQKCKTPEVEHDRSISYINSGQTPGKGILKKTEDAPKNEGKLPKPTYKVNFNDTVQLTEVPEDEVDEDEENRRSLAASLARIENLDFGHDDEVCVNKKLEFDDDDDEDEDENDLEGNIEPSGSEPGAPEGAIEMDEGLGMDTSASSSPIIQISSASPPVTLMPPPTKIKTPKRRKSTKTEDFPVAPIIKITEATPIPQPPGSPESMPSPADVKIRKRGKSRNSGRASLGGKVIGIAESTPSPATPGSPTKRRSALLEFEEIGPSPVVVERKPRSRRTEEPKSEIPIVDITTPQSPKKRGRGRSMSVVELASPSGSGERKYLEKNVDSPLSETISTPKTPRKGRKKSGISSETEKTSGSTPVRQLRSRSVLVDNVTYRKRRTSKHEMNGESIPAEEVNHHHMSDNNGNKENCSGMENVTFQSPKTPKVVVSLDTSSVRRSARKSVRFVPEEDCTTCKPVPLTPRSLKNRVSFFGNPDVVSQPLPNGDLMAFDSPKTPRARIRRSSTK
ncbi:titin [Diachasma alloeum]|uniref:titin n=1 Tax=Diachasma alloeum TaxID=454923 RepID=UPI0007382F2B|nr:titin [Diachasma alloeum]